MKHILLLIIMALFLQKSFSQTYTGDQKEIEAILQNVSNFSAYLLKGEYDKVVASYTTDGKIFPNNLDIIEGAEGLLDYWKPSGENRLIAHKITPTEIKIIGDEAYDYGYYQGTTRLKDGKEISWKGKYVIVWKKIGNDWKIYLDIWNNIRE